MIREFKRFIENVDTNGMHRMGMVLRCWEWTGCSDQKGRPRFYHNDTGELAKRALIEILIEQELPDDCCVKSICGNKLCVRPEHLFPCNDVDAMALGPRGHITSGSAEFIRELHKDGYDAAEIALSQCVSVPLIDAILREGK